MKVNGNGDGNDNAEAGAPVEEILTAPNGVRMTNRVEAGDVNALNVAAKRLRHQTLFPHDYHEQTKRQLQLSLLPTVHYPY